MRPNTKDIIYTGTFLSPFAFLMGGPAGVIMTGLITAAIGANNEAKLKQYEENHKKYEYVPPTEEERKKSLQEHITARRELQILIDLGSITECERVCFKRDLSLTKDYERRSFSYLKEYGSEWISGNMLYYTEVSKFMERVKSTMEYIEKINKRKIDDFGDQAVLIEPKFYFLKQKYSRQKFDLILFETSTDNDVLKIGYGG